MGKLTEGSDGRPPGQEYLERVRQALTSETLLRTKLFAVRIWDQQYSTSHLHRQIDSSDLVSIVIDKTLAAVRPWNQEQCPELVTIHPPH